MGQKKEFERTKSRLEEEITRSRSMLKQLEAHCTHQKKNGRLDLTIKNAEKNVFQCNSCGAQFSISIRTKDEVIAAVDTMKDVLNQMKSLSAEEDYDKYAKRLGDIVADLEEVPVLYTKLVLERGRKNNNNNNNNGRPGHRGKFGSGNVNCFN